MFFVKNAKTYATVWKVTRTEKYTDLKLSTSEKGRDGKIVYSNWYARAIGHAHNSLAGVKEKDRIIIDTVKFSNETRENQDGTKKSYLEVILLEASISTEDGKAPAANKPDDKKATKDDDPAPSASEDELPF